MWLAIIDLSPPASSINFLLPDLLIQPRVPHQDTHPPILLPWKIHPYIAPPPNQNSSIQISNCLLHCFIALTLLP